MPGSTSLGIPYPYQNEIVDATSWQNLATAVDTLLTSLDGIKNQAANPPTAQIFGGAANAVASATTTTITTYTTENWDTGGYANLGVFADGLTLPPGIYYASSSCSFGSVTTLTMARLQIITGATVWGASMMDSTASTSTTLSTYALLMCTAASTQLQVQGRWVGTGGPPNFSSTTLQVLRIRQLADV